MRTYRAKGGTVFEVPDDTDKPYFMGVTDEAGNQITLHYNDFVEFAERLIIERETGRWRVTIQAFTSERLEAIARQLIEDGYKEVYIKHEGDYWRVIAR